MVLEPDLDLRGREPDDGREVFPLGCRQVALLAEAALQLVGLRLGEEDAALALLVAGAGALGGGRGAVGLLVEGLVVGVVLAVVLELRLRLGLEPAHPHRRGVRVQEARRAPRVRQVGHPW